MKRSDEARWNETLTFVGDFAELTETPLKLKLFNPDEVGEVTVPLDKFDKSSFIRSKEAVGDGATLEFSVYWETI